MRFLLFILLLVSFSAISQPGKSMSMMLQNQASPPSEGNQPFSFSEIPYSNDDFKNPGRGAEQWHNGSESINYPTADTLFEPLDVYYRVQWAQLEGSTQGSYTWITSPSDNTFDNLIRGAINEGKQFSFGIMPYYSDGGFVSYDGASSSYPEYLHDAMQALPAADRDVITPAGVWMPNWNSSAYLTRLRALHAALNTHILTTSYTAVAGPHVGESIDYADVIYVIDIRGFGDFGEWHSGGMYPFGSFPGNTQPTAATLMEIIDCHTEEFDNWPLGMMVAGFNGTAGAYYINIFHQYDQVGHYALTATNAWGKVGYRRDQVGGIDQYLIDLLQNNNTTYNGSPAFKTLFLDLYNTAPGTGEPLPGAAPINGMVELEQQVIDYGATSFGNGNWGGFPNPTVQDRIRAAWKRSGYRIKITTGEAPQTITRTVAFTIKTNWENVGTTPAYNDWVVQFELQDINTSAVAWTGTSNKELKLFRPNQGEVETTDILTVPGDVSSGNYKLVVRVRDEVNYRQDMQLAINTQNADGSYTIFSSVTVN